MRISKPGRWIIALASVPVACVTLYLALPLAPTSAPAPRYVAVVFSGFTNDVSGRRFSQFMVSNTSAFRVECSPVGPQIQTNRAWMWLPGYSSVVLKPGEAMTAAVEPPTNARPWRFGVFAIKPPTPIQIGIDRLEPWLPRRLYWLLHGDPRRTQWVQSQTFEQ